MMMTMMHDSINSTNADVSLVFTSIGVVILVGLVLSFMFVTKVIAVYKLTAEAAKQHESEAMAALNDVPASCMFIIIVDRMCSIITYCMFVYVCDSIGW